MDHSDAFAFLNGVHETLAAQPDLSPDNPHVNTCLGHLVATLQDWQRVGFGQDLADQPEFFHLARDLPRLCAAAECEMEKWWCRRILASGCPGAKALAAFWYLDEYEALCRSEMRLMGGGAEPGRHACLGSGALPVTAILLATSDKRAHVTCVDCDAEACALAEQLVALLGLAGRIRVMAGKAEDYHPSPEERILCASLLDAPPLYERLFERRARHLIVRDAEGPYRFCYRPARLPDARYEEKARSRPCPERINTSRYFRYSEAFA